MQLNCVHSISSGLGIGLGMHGTVRHALACRYSETRRIARERWIPSLQDKCTQQHVARGMPTTITQWYPLPPTTALPSLTTCEPSTIDPRMVPRHPSKQRRTFTFTLLHHTTSHPGRAIELRCCLVPCQTTSGVHMQHILLKQSNFHKTREPTCQLRHTVRAMRPANY